MQVGHHHRRDVRVVDAALAQLRRGSLVGTHVDVPVEQRRQAAEVRARLHRNRGVEAGVDEDPARARMLDQEALDRCRDPLVLRHTQAERLAPCHAPLRAQEPPDRASHRGGEDGVQLDLRVPAAAGERQLGRTRLGGGGHPREPYSRRGRPPASSRQNAIMAR
jgi:hypothetical protein